MTYVKGVWVDDDGSGTTGTTVSKARMDNIEQGIADAHAGKTVIPVVTALPAGPVDGQQIAFLVDDTKGIVWHLRYRAFKADGVTPNPSGFKWEFVGGPPMFGYQAAADSISNAAWADLPTAGPEITCPLAGDYYCEWGARMYGSVAAQSVHLGLKVATGAVQPGLLDHYTGSNSTMNPSVATNDSRTNLLTGVQAFSVVRMLVETTAGTGVVHDRWMKLTPIRLNDTPVAISPR